MSHGYVFISLCYTSRDDWCNVRIYLHIGVRLRVARFNDMGNAKALHCEASNK